MNGHPVDHVSARPQDSSAVEDPPAGVMRRTGDHVRHDPQAVQPRDRLAKPGLRCTTLRSIEMGQEYDPHHPRREPMDAKPASFAMYASLAMPELEPRAVAYRPKRR